MMYILVFDYGAALRAGKFGDNYDPDYEFNGPFESRDVWLAEAKKIDAVGASQMVLMCESHLDGSITVVEVDKFQP